MNRINFKRCVIHLRALLKQGRKIITGPPTHYYLPYPTQLDLLLIYLTRLPTQYSHIIPLPPPPTDIAHIKSALSISYIVFQYLIEQLSTSTTS